MDTELLYRVLGYEPQTEQKFIDTDTKPEPQNL